jgi:hypothetical protein
MWYRAGQLTLVVIQICPPVARPPDGPLWRVAGALRRHLTPTEDQYPAKGPASCGGRWVRNSPVMQ